MAYRKSFRKSGTASRGRRAGSRRRSVSTASRSGYRGKSSRGQTLNIVLHQAPIAGPGTVVPGVPGVVARPNLPTRPKVL